MKNPLALFTGAALTTLAALAGLNMTDWPGKSGDAQKLAETGAETPKPAAEETAKTPEKAPEKAADKPAEVAALTQPDPATTEPPKTEAGAQIKPELDTVRVESDGQAIVAGRAQPGAEVALKLGEAVIGKGIANADGSWVVVPDQPLPKGTNEITIEQKTANSAPVTAGQSIAVAVPEKPGQQAMVALTEPGTATKVLQTGGNQEQVAENEPASPDQPQPAETASGEPQPAETASDQPKTAEAAQPQPAAPEAAKPAEPQTTTMAKTEAPATTAEKAPEKPAAVQPAPKNLPLQLDAVDYNDKGDIIFSGRAKPGTTVRLYVDNGAVGDAPVDPQGNWSFSGKDIIAPGKHNLRADQLEPSGKVIARIELPFLREDATAVAALNEQAKPAETEAQKQPEPQTTTAEATPQAGEAQPSQATQEQPSSGTVATKTTPEAQSPAPGEPATAEKKSEPAVAAVTEEAAKTVDPDKPRSGKVVIQPGNNLWKLSRVIYGRGKNYTVIYQANKDQIRNPARIYPGQIFAIPGAMPPESIDPKRKEPLTSAEGGAAQ